ncbi:MAG: energy-coupling factor ABC transporter ATP-binding protein [Acidimicrobiia bacterium]|nr:energy-coupling factor ABC transporter ATP-binding protein [Acidimicrobiia bacterium]
MNAPAIDVRNVSYTYPDGREALRGLDLTVEQDPKVAILGPNGAGKTTLALHLNGLLVANRGTIQIGDLVLTEETTREIRRRVGLVFQNPNDQLFMPTVSQDVAFGPANLGLKGDALEERVSEALGAVEAGRLGDRAPHHLSGGEQRRAAIATVLAMRPDVLVLDEPASGLDPAGRRDLIRTLAGLSITQLVITHDLAFAYELCDRSVVMNEGRIVADGSTGDIMADADLLAQHRLELPYPMPDRET